MLSSQISSPPGPTEGEAARPFPIVHAGEHLAPPGLRWSSRSDWWYWAALAVIVGAAAALRFFRIDAQSLWYDEGISAHQLVRSYPEIAVAASLDTHPPLYYWTLKAWASVFGSNELGLRSLSAVSGIAMVCLTVLLGRNVSGRAAALVAALLVAVAPLAVYYSQETRMYTMVTALGLLAAWAYVRKSYWLYAIAAAATLYTQYLGIAFLAALNLHALYSWRALGRRGWVTWLAANLVAAAVFVPWLPVFIAQSTGRALNTSPRTGAGLAEAVAAGYGGGIDSTDLAVATGMLLVAAAVLGAVLILGSSGKRHAGLLAILVWVSPLALVLALGFRSGLFELRYLLLSLPGLALLAGTAVAWLARGPARTFWPVGTVAAVLLAGLLLMGFGGGLADQYFNPALARDDYRGAVAEIERDAQPGDAILMVAPNQVEVFSYYYHGSLDVYPLPAQRPIDVADTEQRLRDIEAHHPRAWLLSWAQDQADADGHIASWLSQNGFQASHAWYGGLQLSLISLGQVAASHEVGLDLDNGITLERWGVNGQQLRPGDTLQVALVWRAREAPTERWKVFTHLLDEADQVVAQRDAEPGDELRPTTGWKAGDMIDDSYGIAIPDDLPLGAYRLEIGMYQEDGTRATFEGVGNHVILGTVQLSP